MNGFRWLSSAALSLTLACQGQVKHDSSRHSGSQESSGAPSAEHAQHDGRAEATPIRTNAGHAEDGHASTANSAPPQKVAGYAAFVLDAKQAGSMGLATTPVSQRAFSKNLRTTGVVTLDETRTSHIHSKIRGWIESVTVDFVGKQVRAGQPLCTIYSQEVYAAQLEFLGIVERASAPTASSGAFAQAEQSAREQMLQAARRRLSLWDVPQAEIQRLERTREPRRTFTLNSPRTGIVLSKQALAGMFIDPSVELYVVSDVSRLWVLADVYEADAPFVKLGDKANLTIEGLGSDARQGTVSFIPPTIEESTRTLKVRFELENKDLRVRPGAFATVTMSAELGRSLAIPESAVIHAGPRMISFVHSGERIEPRDVMLGPIVDGYYRVERGLREGEHVVTSAQFLIDSESRLRATSGPGASHGGH